jgi:mannose-6-phosphate isomerase-like protein (cupin superfamily)
MQILSENSPLSQYRWGDSARCECWNLVDEPSLSVKLERMAPKSAEQMHWHDRAQQFFFILKGAAVLEAGGEKIRLSCREGMRIPPGLRHRILNEETDSLEFLLASEPSVSGDRIEATSI